mmetsp:Transcript_8054/g.13912  ORF Transcript_8054/g.13912 Transcript_8054/m.13912 type:complete len:152 (+) Transcript_8054:56-511(+)
MAADLSEAQIAEFQETFEMFDADQSGEISTLELKQCLEKLGQKLTMEEVCEMVREVDTDGNGNVDFSEFLTMMANKFNGDDLEKECAEAFKNLFDKDGDGFLSAPELKHVMASLGENLTDKDIDEMMIEADKDGDGLVSYNEFKTIIMGKN